jgi:hypothetical protein
MTTGDGQFSRRNKEFTQAGQLGGRVGAAVRRCGGAAVRTFFGI